ncbi:pyridoxamine 5'-phosphate oxidase family protein [Cytobacillus kochii]|uniref:pyridoxamine 5'-phosphate oxidase family protein n=1 Tax=Cytobacillus kochii TaxID=859143 RepID=UPI001CD24F92|nr:pyridoxamine 5'-phosphate oxidase family protein [Cytobacillus kochii]MCA1027957.1 pyridoxamine 5'-phosphate oxidase family protein [Cytobacillus kochii]MCM3323868.1 pyridoxamine 5'-phosphate oxidase family protein [Cytobacillus kochii]MCM3346265.1 pyridoxamine 5'-phosphate oxidase family protein [Cytobacillus kochii]
MFNNVIQSEEELEALFTPPSKAAANKVISIIDEHCKDFLARSPFLFLATTNKDGQCDNSPRGDYPGFVQVLDEKHLVIPDRPGNRRLDSMHNILSNPQVGLLFIIPGLNETLRINGKASIIQDEDILAKMADKGKAPLLGIAVEVEECFLHCANSFNRAGIWKPETWLAKESLPSPAKMFAAHIATNVIEKV